MSGVREAKLAEEYVQSNKGTLTELEGRIRLAWAGVATSAAIASMFIVVYMTPIIREGRLSWGRGGSRDPLTLMRLIVSGLGVLLIGAVPVTACLSYLGTKSQTLSLQTYLWGLKQFACDPKAIAAGYRSLDADDGYTTGVAGNGWLHVVVLIATAMAVAASVVVALLLVIALRLLVNLAYRRRISRSNE